MAVDPANYFCEKLPLYTLWRRERQNLLNGPENYELAFKEKEYVIIQRMQKYEPLSTVMEKMLKVNVNILAEQHTEFVVEADSNVTDNKHDIDNIN